MYMLNSHLSRKIAVAIGLVTGRPISVAIGPTIGHVQGTDRKRQSDSCAYFMLCCLCGLKELGC